MNEHDLQQIEDLLTRKLDEHTSAFDRKLDKLDSKLDAVVIGLTERIEASERRTGALLESLEDKVDLVIEGQQALVERMDRMELRQKEYDEKLDHRITSLAADLVAHRSDPIAHHRGFSVKEEEENFE